MLYLATMYGTLRRSARSIVGLGTKIGWWKVGAGAAIILVGAGFTTTLRGKGSEPSPAPSTPLVEVRSVAELSSNAVPFSIVGAVQSKSEATVRAEKSGQVVAVYKALGEAIVAGEVAAELEHGSESAALLQAQGSMEAAQANLDKITGGVRSEQRDILGANVDSAKAALASARSSAVNALLSAYAAADNAIRGTADTMFSNPESQTPHFNISSPNSQLTLKIENQRVMLALTLTREAKNASEISVESNLVAELNATESELRNVRGFLDDIVTDLNQAIASQQYSVSAISTYQANATAARTSITSSLAAIASAKQALETNASALEVAQKNLEQGITGGQSEDVAASRAALKQAQGAVAAVKANLEKAIIRAPISGTINSFSLKRGDYVQATSPVLTVANNGALEILAYVTESDARDIAVGSRASLEGGATGVVTHIAPAIDPQTKKIEVRIGVNDPQKTLVNGQSVLVSLARTTRVSDASRISVPISAIKVGSESNVVFTVDEKGMLVAHIITLGALLGDRVVISEGLTPEMKIVTDARGLREGQSVQLK